MLPNCLRRDTDAKTVSVIVLKQGRVTTLNYLNATRDYVQGRKLVEAGGCLLPNRPADAAVPLKSMHAEMCACYRRRDMPPLTRRIGIEDSSEATPGTLVSRAVRNCSNSSRSRTEMRSK